MAYEVKVIIKMLAGQIIRAKSLEDVYAFLEDAANVEGIILESYADAKSREASKGEE